LICVTSKELIHLGVTALGNYDSFCFQNSRMAERHSFGVNPITCHAWNRDRTRKLQYQHLGGASLITVGEEGHVSSVYWKDTKEPKSKKVL
jgi:hypothetical protein